MRDVEPLPRPAATRRRGIGIRAGYEVREAGAPDTLTTIRADRERLPRVERQNAIGLPATNQKIQDPVHVSAESFAMTEGDIVYEPGCKVVPDIPRRTGVGARYISGIAISEPA